jgi:MHS family proline/betaine transporter-like MFS transporter
MEQSLHAPASASRARSGLSFAQWKMILIASLGGSLEYYDFIVYGLFAHNLAAQFFPTQSAFLSTLLSLSVFAIGYVIRPLGGVVLSSWGDRYGRRPVFLVSIFVVTLATIALGLLPGYDRWGIFAPALLVLLRMLQGFCVGGEMPGAITYAVEAAPHRAGIAGAAIICAINVGVLLATFVNFCIQNTLSPHDAGTYGWRIAFLFGGLCGVASFWMRRNLDESPEFKEMQQGVVRQPLVETLRHHARAVFAGVLTIAVMAAVTGILYGHMPVYLIQQLHYSPREVALAQNVLLGVSVPAVLLSGWLADRITRRLLLQLSALLLIVLAWPFYQALVHHSTGLVTLFAIVAVVFALSSGTWPSILADQFPVQVRYTGIALAYNLAVVLFSGFGPLVATLLIRETDSLAGPAWYVMAVCALSFVASLALPVVRKR